MERRRQILRAHFISSLIAHHDAFKEFHRKRQKDLDTNAKNVGMTHTSLAVGCSHIGLAYVNRLLNGFHQQKNERRWPT
jgi:hypothetical protein